MAVQKVKLKIGTVYQKEDGGIYYFRYQVNGARKAVSLKTRNKQDALKEAERLIPILQATSSEVIAAHVQQARNMERQKRTLLLTQAWDAYAQSPDRAIPDTVHETLSHSITVWHSGLSSRSRLYSGVFSFGYGTQKIWDAGLLFLIHVDTGTRYLYWVSGSYTLSRFIIVSPYWLWNGNTWQYQLS